MNEQEFESLVTRLERDALNHPQRYLATALAVVLLGFGVLVLAILLALLPILLLGLLLLAVIATGGKALIVLLKLGKLLLLLILPAWLMVKASLQMLLSRLPRPQGRLLQANEAPALFARIDELRQRMQGPRIHYVLLTEELNAAIVQHPRFGMFGWEENFLILGLPLLQTLSEEEALAVVAHEYGHLSGHHGRLGGFIYRFRGAWGRLQELSGQWQDWGSRLIARLFRWYAPYFNAYTFVLARQNEYIADRASVEIAGRQQAAAALMRINVAAQFEDEVFWPAVNRMVATAPQPLDSRYGYWAQSLRERLDEPMCVRYLNIASKRRTDHLDTHPALSDRLRAMGAGVDGEAARTLTPPLCSAAEVWLGESHLPLQAEFDRDWRESVAARWQERHKQLMDQQQRRVALESKNLLSSDEQWEYIKLVEELDPEQDLLPSLNQLLEQEAEHLSARFRRGLLLTERGEEAGIGDLERVMQQDEEAILPGCQAAWRFYRESNAAKAEHYRARWQERSDYQERVDAESQTVLSDATLAAHGLDTETEARIRAIVVANGQYIRCAYLLRRIFKYDNRLHDYVLAFETKSFTFGDKSQQVLDRLAEQQFPVRTFIIPLNSQTYKGMRKRIKQLGVTPLVSQ